jgi:hypothetical protein
MDKKLVELSEQGASREVIARSLTIMMGALVTKNSVCGRAHRLGCVSERTLSIRRGKTPTLSHQKSTVKNHRYFHVPVSHRVLPPVGEFNLKGNPGGCLYMEGDARDRNFCGAPTVRRTPLGSGCWCSKHYTLVFQADKKAA